MADALACNILAISAARRPRYHELVNRLHSAMHQRKELPAGYTYVLRSNEITLPEVAEWVTMERLCCPFLIFELGVAGEMSRLTMRGPEGVKAILQAEFPSG
jgi:hypothetical protein